MPEHHQTPALPQPATGTRATRIRNLSALRRGDSVEARLKGAVLYAGRVVTTAPGVGLVWIREVKNGPRRTLSQQEYSIWQVPGPA